ncbi:hypothetical protein PFICI_13075 [Pestalotiopsis fici W106-1]|uniref:Xylanolytic transcriptional activator regulatory domain-containing protein n=1 Tax=Pestalotiopsis fici (strain W106-1 / CGMCC3.15140) TaxID=1229662 RepID=W3WP48_PESFW|nr:uncharacterized protein PFICI_13075 [Pestalotiopsis fici W106-1]ETS74591.1 hypothetical protein PFICI_13075 [Pestalotiopsis fici W106-1]
MRLYTVCAVAARFYNNGILYNVLLRHAREAGLEAMLSSKSTATVQGFVILATWSQPSVSYETDNAYLYAGIAIRLGVEIGLHRKIALRYPDNTEPHIKRMYVEEVLSRERTWFCVFILDRSMSALTGKPPQAPETYAIRDVDKWWRRSECTLSDVFISAHAQLLRLLYRCFDVIYSCNDTFTGVSTGLNYQVVVKDLQWRLDEWAQIWAKNLRDFDAEQANEEPLETYLSILNLSRSFYNLVPLSFGLHHCTVDGFNRVDQISFVTRCYECATRTLQVATKELNPNRVFKVAPDICVIAVTYAACFLLKLIGPEFKHIFDEAVVLDLIKETLSLLEKSSEDERHTHHLHAMFLRRHIDRYQAQDSSCINDAPTQPGQQPPPQQQQHQHQQQQPSFFVSNSMTDLGSTDVCIDVDGSINFPSLSGNGIIRPTADMSSDWIDTVLGMQSRRDDPFSTGLQMAPWSGIFGNDFTTEGMF